MPCNPDVVHYHYRNKVKGKECDPGPEDKTPVYLCKSQYDNRYKRNYNGYFKPQQGMPGRNNRKEDPRTKCQNQTKKTHSSPIFLSKNSAVSMLQKSNTLSFYLIKYFAFYSKVS